MRDGRRQGRDPPASASCGAELRGRVVQIIVGLTCAGVFLGIALYRVPIDAVVAALAHTSPAWLSAALFVYAVNLASRAWRWQMILRPTLAISFPIVARVLVVGYGLNAIMPLRLGELFRAEFLKKTCGAPRVQALTSIVIERLLDGLTVVACLGAGLLLAARTGQPAAALLADVLAMGGALFGAALLVALCLGGRRITQLCAGFPHVSGLATAVSTGLAILRTGRTVPLALMTLIVYVLEGLSIWCVVKAVGLPLGLPDMLVLIGAASLSTLLPSGPGFLGTLQFAYALAIGFAGANGALGVAAATLAQCCLMLPVAVVAMGVLAHGSGGILRQIFARRAPGEAAEVYSTGSG
jgi:glycosyltransferase 2 family protein